MVHVDSLAMFPVVVVNRTHIGGRPADVTADLLRRPTALFRSDNGHENPMRHTEPPCCLWVFRVVVGWVVVFVFLWIQPGGKAKKDLTKENLTPRSGGKPISTHVEQARISRELRCMVWYGMVW